MPGSRKYKREWYLKNKERIIKANKKWAKNNPEKIKEYRRTYKEKHGTDYQRIGRFIKLGIKRQDIFDLIKKGGNVCPICKKEKDKLYIDHCHKTNKLRGMVCRECNLGLGHFDDNILYLNNAINYLNK